jgi:hypothetical protein
MRVPSLFGYFSIREVKEGLDLSLQESIDRLRYLQRTGLLQRFPSQTYPPEFFCLTTEGRQMVKDFRISDQTSSFLPSSYHKPVQNHTRLLVTTYLTLKKILGDDLREWVGEEELLREAGSTNGEGQSWSRRVWDGEMLIQVHKIHHVRNQAGEIVPTGEVSQDIWRCGLELELSLKSPNRYSRLFEVLQQEVYSLLLEKLKVPIMIFVCGSQTIRDRLLKHYQVFVKGYGRCIFYFVLLDDLLARRREARVLRMIGRDEKFVQAGDLARVCVVTYEA